MRKRFKNIIFLKLILHTFFVLTVSAQNSIDSLLKVLESQKEDTAKVNTLNNLAQKICTKQPEKSMEYAMEAMSLSKRLDFNRGKGDAFLNIGLSFRYQNSYNEAIDNFKHALNIRKEINQVDEIATTYENIGNVEFMQGNYPDAIKNYLESLRISEKIGDKKRIAKSSNNLGLVYMTQGNYAEALQYYIKSLKIKEDLSKESPEDISSKRGIAASYNNIGSVHMYQGNNAEALDYYLKAIKIRQEVDDKKGLAEAYNNIGNIYATLNDFSKAIDYNNSALAIKQELGDTKGMATSYMNIGTLYQKEKQPDEALKFHLESVKLYEELTDKNGLATSYYNIGSTYNVLKKYLLSIEYLNKSSELANEIGSKRIIQHSYQELAEVYSKINKHDKAYDYHKLFSAIKDSIFNETKANQIADLDKKYGSEKKEKEIELLTKQNELHEVRDEKNMIFIYSISGGFLLVLVLAVVSLRGYRQKKKANNQLEDQNKKISNQKQIIEAKNKDITDSIVYAKRIQEAILPPKKVLDEAFNDYFILFKPKDIVSGDFYWFNESKDQQNNLKYIAAVDCTGHGVPGAFMSIIGHTALNQAVNEHGKTKASEILEEVNEILSETLRNNHQESDVKDGMDIALCAFDSQNKTVNYSGAFNPLWIVKKDSTNIVEIKADKHPIGSFLDEGYKSFTNHEIKLEEGDSVYIFSDGFSDQFGGPNGKKFKPKQFREILLSSINQPMSAQKRILDNAIETWKGSLEQIDDILVIGFRV